MALSTQVEENLKDVESSLRAALSYAARTERPVVITVISDLIYRIESIMSTDKLLDTLESNRLGNSGNSGVS